MSTLPLSEGFDKRLQLEPQCDSGKCAMEGGHSAPYNLRRNRPDGRNSTVRQPIIHTKMRGPVRSAGGVELVRDLQ